MLKSLSSYNRMAFDVVNIIAGLGLLLSPWHLGYAAETYAAWNAWIVVAAVTLIAVAALYTFHQVEKWANVALDLWTARANLRSAT
ncbi:SPW repeat protein [Brucella sp. C7-11G]